MIKKIKITNKRGRERENSGNKARKYAVWFRLYLFKVKLDPRMNWTGVWTCWTGLRLGEGLTQSR